MKKEYCVYKITNTINNKLYIGLSKDLNKRWSHNGDMYKPKNKNSSRFYNAIMKYGWSSFKKEIIKDNLNKEEAAKLEKDLINKYNTRNKNFGYNIAEGGFGGKIYLTHPKGFLNKKHTEEWKKNHSKAMAGKNNPFYGKSHKVHPKGFLNKKHTQYSKNKTSQTMKDKGINKKRIKSISPEGKEKTFSSVSECCVFYLDRKNSNVILKLLKSGEKYKIHKSLNKHLIPVYKPLEGYRFEYEKDDSEICY